MKYLNDGSILKLFRKPTQSVKSYAGKVIISSLIHYTLLLGLMASHSLVAAKDVYKGRALTEAIVLELDFKGSGYLLITASQLGADYQLGCCQINLETEL